MSPIITSRGVKDRYGVALVEGGQVWPFWRDHSTRGMPLTEEALRNAFRRVSGPRVLVDFGFDEVEYTYPERFERRFGIGAARHWKLKRRPASAGLFSKAMKEHFIEPIREQLSRGTALLFPEPPKPYDHGGSP